MRKYFKFLGFSTLVVLVFSYHANSSSGMDHPKYSDYGENTIFTVRKLQSDFEKSIQLTDEICRDAQNNRAHIGRAIFALNREAETEQIINKKIIDNLISYNSLYHVNS